MCFVNVSISERQLYIWRPSGISKLSKMRLTAAENESKATDHRVCNSPRICNFPLRPMLWGCMTRMLTSPNCNRSLQSGKTGSGPVVLIRKLICTVF
ncbi:hypothetical protein TNCV_5085671 [Trichonephila clavipes]|uniref:Uncharacterized protein n=1 Tax=Trichonephila clavipes TaxID=2585209 RepID=A0A8X6S4M4_TRICX|nr:hypothetical protein TNCV_5085671 [Trichonephila clavipes]